MTAARKIDFDNAKLDLEHIAAIATSREATHTDRLAQVTPTLYQVLSQIGYLPPVAYSAGIVFDAGDFLKTVERNGTKYAPRPSALPFTTSGTWPGSDETRFYVAQGVRQEDFDPVRIRVEALTIVVSLGESVDNLPQINAALASSEAVYLAAGTFGHSARVSLSGKRLFGPGKLKPLPGYTDRQVVIIQGSNSVLEVDAYDGTNMPSPSAAWLGGGSGDARSPVGCGVFVNGSTGSPLTGVVVKAKLMTGFPSGPVCGFSAPGIKVQVDRALSNQTYAGAETNGVIHLHECHGARVDDGRIEGLKWKGVAFGNCDDAVATGVKVKNGVNGQAGHYMQGGKRSGFARCSHEGGGGDAHKAFQAEDAWVDGYTSVNSGGVGVYFDSCDGAVADHIIVRDSASYGVMVTGVSAHSRRTVIDNYLLTRSSAGSSLNHRGIYLLPTSSSGTVSAAVANTPSAGQVRVTLNSVAGLSAGRTITFASVTGMTDLNQTLTIAAVNSVSNTVDVTLTTSQTYVSGGTWLATCDIDTVSVGKGVIDRWFFGLSAGGPGAGLRVADLSVSKECQISNSTQYDLLVYAESADIAPKIERSAASGSGSSSLITTASGVAGRCLDVSGLQINGVGTTNVLLEIGGTWDNLILRNLKTRFGGVAFRLLSGAWPKNLTIDGIEAWDAAQVTAVDLNFTTGNQSRVHIDNVKLPLAAGNVRSMGFTISGGSTLVGFVSKDMMGIAVPGGANRPLTVRPHMGAGSPEGVVVAPIGEVFYRTDGGVGTSFYVKQVNNTTAVGWAAK